jgi:phage shock protein A
MFARIGRLFRGFLGLFISGIEEANPEALMEAARQEFRGRMTQYNLALAKMAGVAERLKTQVNAKATRAQELERRILANHRAGNMDLAGALARELQELKADLQTDSSELKETEEAYDANLRQAKLAQREFEDKVRRLEKQLSQVKIKEAQAEAASALSSVAFKVGDLGDTMKRVDEVLQKRYEVSAGKARLAKDMVDMETVQEKENERKALEQVALAEFLASQGIQSAAPPAETTPVTSKEIGPERRTASLGSPRSASSSRSRSSRGSSRSASIWSSAAAAGSRTPARPPRAAATGARRTCRKSRSRFPSSRRPPRFSTRTTRSRSRSASTRGMRD